MVSLERLTGADTPAFGLHGTTGGVWCPTAPIDHPSPRRVRASAWRVGQKSFAQVPPPRLSIEHAAGFKVGEIFVSTKQG